MISSIFDIQTIKRQLDPDSVAPDWRGQRKEYKQERMFGRFDRWMSPCLSNISEEQRATIWGAPPLTNDRQPSLHRCTLWTPACPDSSLSTETKIDQLRQHQEPRSDFSGCYSEHSSKAQWPRRKKWHSWLLLLFHSHRGPKHFSGQSTEEHCLQFLLPVHH